MLLNGKRIFVIEDDPNNLAVISTVLRQGGAAIFFERWGRQTTQKLCEILPIDIILLDLMLPSGITGYQIFDEIRAITGLEKIPIVAVTAADPDIEMLKVRDKGFNGFISKPIRTNSFNIYVKTALDKGEVWYSGS